MPDSMMYGYGQMHQMMPMHDKGTYGSSHSNPPPGMGINAVSGSKNDAANVSAASLDAANGYNNAYMYSMPYMYNMPS